MTIENNIVRGHLVPEDPDRDTLGTPGRPFKSIHASDGSGLSGVIDSGAVRRTNNLSDLNSPAAARTSLGLGTIATHPTTDFVNRSVAPTVAIQALTWSTYTVAASPWTEVAWSPELRVFVGVASNGGVVSSLDGQVWTTRTASEANQWRSVAWSPSLGLFAAVAATGTNRVMTSSNGTAWTARAAAAASSWTAVAWSPELGLFVAVADSGTARVMTSPDGVTWTARTAAEANSWQSVAWSPALSLLVAVALDGTNRVMSSQDGVTWTARAAAAASGWRSVAWSAETGTFVAVANSGAGSRAMSSTDGITWAARAIAGSAWQKVAWGAELGLFLAVASVDLVASSPDGITWTSRANTGSGTDLESLAYSSELGLFVVLDGVGDGIAARTRPLQPGTFNGLSGSIGGAALLAGACASGNVTVPGAATNMSVSVSPNTYPGDGNIFFGYVSSANTVTVKVCATIAGTPTASTYNVRVHP